MNGDKSHILPSSSSSWINSVSKRENELAEGIKKAAEGTKNSIQGGMVRNRKRTFSSQDDVLVL
jgi:hypothetical protein